MSLASQDLRQKANFWRHVERREDCLIWVGCRTKKGYGHFMYRNRKLYAAHRLAWIWANGQIPNGMQIDHLCRNRSCVNPVHMELVTNKINQFRGQSVSGLSFWKIRCSEGHLLLGDNLYPWQKNRRTCRICHNARETRYREARRGL
jgi:HNH endonuclease